MPNTPINPDMRSLPISNLGLPRPARKATAKFKNIGELLQALEDSKTPRPKWDKIARRSVESALERLSRQELECGPQIDRVNGIKPASQAAALISAGTRLEHLNSETRRVPITTLNLGVRAQRALERINVCTLGDLIHLAQLGFAEIRDDGSKSGREILASLKAMALSISAAGGVDWDEFALQRHLLLIPSEPVAWNEETALRNFEGAVRQAVGRQFGKIEGAVLEALHFNASAQTLPNVAVASLLGITPRMFHCFQGRISRVLRQTVLHNDYTGCAFRFRDGFTASLRECIRRAHDTSGARSARQAGGDDPIKCVIRLIGTSRGMRRRTAAKPLPVGKQVSAWILHFLGDTYPEGITASELCRALQWKFWKLAPAETELVRWLNASPRTVFDPNAGVYCVVDSCLKRTNDRCHRVLEREGKPMHLSDILRGVNRQGRPIPGATTRSIGIRMSRDDRFIWTGFRGWWALARWK